MKTVRRVLQGFRSNLQATPLPVSNIHHERDSAGHLDYAWLRTAAICSTLIPGVLYLLGIERIPQFSPRHVIYSGDIMSLLLAPWASPHSLPAAVSRLVQAALFWYLPPLALPTTYGIWLAIGAARTPIGHLFSRGLGWAYPQFFSHHALYETIAGFGPMIWAYCELLANSNSDDERVVPRLNSYALIGLAAILCWLDEAPWTYMVTLILVTVIQLLQALSKRTRWRYLGSSKVGLLVQLRNLICRTIILFALFALPIYLPLLVTRSTHIPTMPPSPSPTTPLLDILILSFPRPNAALILNMTVTSFLPYLSRNVRLSAFTHSLEHPAFEAMQKQYKDTDVTFYVDRDSHPESVQGQYLHLAEAFRWQHEKPQKAEWVMLIEDDFPLCGGEKGWEAIVQVMEILESGRADEENDGKTEKSKIPERRAGFVGTGGSGFIIHHTLIPTLIHILRTHSDIIPKFTSGVTARPPDVVVQDCLLGRDPVCPARRKEGLVITSRLVLDHIGGLSSTNLQKAPNSDKWRCGWRHPFHGWPEVQVVVVEGMSWMD